MPELDRRDFLKLVGVGAGAAAASGCSEPVEKLIPYVIQQETITPGIPVVYASTCRECPVGCGLHVTTHEGRPTKLEGNPDHPINRGSLCARGQAGIGRTYHPDRHKGPQRRGADGALAPVGWDEALEELAGKIAANPRGTYLLGGPVGPTASGALDAWVRAVGAGGRVVYEPLAAEAVREASRALFGRAGVPRFDLGGADLVIDFGSDALETGLSPTEHARQLMESRALGEGADGGARFVYVGARMSMTASNADLWLPARPGTEGLVALAVARRAAQARGADTSALDRLGRVGIEDAAARSGLDAAQIEALADALARAERPVALPPGVGVATRRAVGSAAAVLALNHALGAFGRAVHLEAEPAERARASHRETLRLVEAMKAGEVSVLIVHDADPLYSLPASAGFEAALEKVDLVVSTSPLLDQTSARAGLVLPDHTPLEAWGDAEPRAGVRSLQQPTVRPLLDTRALVDTLHDTGRALGGAVADAMPAQSFRMLVEQAWSGTDWREALARGGAFSEPAGASAVPAVAGSGTLEVGEPVLEGDGDLTLLAFPHPFLYDGRGASLPWLQEIPDPATKIAWQSWAEVSNATAAKLGVSAGDVVAVETPAGRLEVPVYPRGGIRDDVIAIPTGQGHTVGHYASLAGDGQPGQARGVNVLDVLPAVTDESGGRAWLTARARVSKTGRFQRLPLVQASDDKRRRMLGEAVSLEVASGTAAKAHGGGGGHGGGHGEVPSPVYDHVDMPVVDFDPASDSTADSPYRWGMSIDLDRCTGCSACVAACYVENNVPVVGEEGTLRARQMSWIRIERWIGEGSVDYVGDEGLGRRLRPHREELGGTDVRHSPMLCQQCGAAPCESVCPVYATYHNPEGLNGMVYNRCVGTRYCSNNCPYKVRRFNYFDYSRENWPGLFYLMLNPDVTVRGQGVMEKCTFCVQRIERARQPAKDQNRPIRDGEVVTACQQACPTQAIAFGNLKDPDSAVSKKSDDPRRGYRALHVLNTRPAITYHAVVKRGVGEVSG